MANSQGDVAEQNQHTPTKTGNRPVDKFRDGPVHVSIWENDSVNGAFRSASFELRFKKQDQWQSSHSYGQSDLQHLEKAAAEARSRIEKWRKGKTQPAHEAAP